LKGILYTVRKYSNRPGIMAMLHKIPLQKPAYEVADVFNLYIDDYLKTHNISSNQSKVVWRITHCRTASLGGHLLECEHCHYQEISYNSCRDRHCPKCQYSLKEEWVKSRIKELLPIPYYHVVFTLPHALNDLILYNKEVFYDLLFKSASGALKEFSRDSRYLGAEIGFIGILHTWGQKLGYHVHVHFIVSGGGYDSEKGWVPLPYKGKFLFPVRALSKMYRGKFISGLKKVYYKESLKIPDSLSYIRAGHMFESFLDEISYSKWRVYCKKPFSGPEEVIRYIGRYTHRVAISNYRLKSILNNQVLFSYKDYKDNNRIKTLTLSSAEFIRRYLLHILPKGFKKIRFYGFWSGSRKKEIIKQLSESLCLTDSSEGSHEEEIKEETVLLCSHCGLGRMHVVLQLEPYFEFPYANTS